MKIVFEQIREFVNKTFPEAGSKQHLLKAKQEIKEAIESNDITEYADVIIAMFAAATKSDYSFLDLEQAIKRKMIVNKKRKWKKLKDGTHQHID